jgi:hypothetical protein
MRRRPRGLGLVYCDCGTPNPTPLFLWRNSSKMDRENGFWDFRWNADRITWSEDGRQVTGLCSLCRRRFDLFLGIRPDWLDHSVDNVHGGNLDRLETTIRSDFGNGNQQIDLIVQRSQQARGGIRELRLIYCCCCLSETSLAIMSEQTHITFCFDRDSKLRKLARHFPNTCTRHYVLDQYDADTLLQFFRMNYRPKFEEGFLREILTGLNIPLPASYDTAFALVRVLQCTNYSSVERIKECLENNSLPYL